MDSLPSQIGDCYRVLNFCCWLLIGGEFPEEDRLTSQKLWEGSSCSNRVYARAKMLADMDYKESTRSEICTVTEDARQREGEYVAGEKNVALLKKFISELVIELQPQDHPARRLQRRRCPNLNSPGISCPFLQSS